MQADTPIFQVVNPTKNWHGTSSINASLLHLGHHPEPVSAQDSGDVGLAVAAAEQMQREVYHLGRVGKAPYAAVTVEVCAQSHMLHAHYADGMLKVGNGVHHGGFSPVVAQEAVIQRDMGHPSLRSKRTELLVGEVARHVAKRLAVAVAAHYGR